MKSCFFCSLNWNNTKGVLQEVLSSISSSNFSPLSSIFCESAAALMKDSRRISNCLFFQLFKVVVVRPPGQGEENKMKFKS